MKRIVIYVEGGGDSTSQQAELRRGFDQLFIKQKQAAGRKRLSLRFVLSGSRNGACRDFLVKMRTPEADTVYGLLVDSEDAIALEAPGKSVVNAQVRKRHLINRDGSELNEVPEERIHLMVHCMEAWIVADADALAKYFGAGFKPKKLPANKNLEEVPKETLYRQLADATKETSKGEYSEANQSKIKHATKLLEVIDPIRVAARCPRFATFTKWLDDLISPPEKS
ncbi:MAG: DUF4276 family protein [Planctomycetaceae bacterium]